MKLLPFNDYDLKTPKILEALNEATRSLADLLVQYLINTF